MPTPNAMERNAHGKQKELVCRGDRKDMLAFFVMDKARRCFTAGASSLEEELFNSFQTGAKVRGGG